MTVSLKFTNNRRRLNNRGLPDDIINNDKLNEAILTLLPKNYNFEIHKTIARIRELNCRRIALQFPEGLMLFAHVLTKIFVEFASCNNKKLSVIILGDVTYGACCVDDFAARAMNCDLLIHYGHSCLVPLDITKTFYVFVDIQFDTKHLIDTIIANFEAGKHIIIVATIQFTRTLQSIKDELTKTFTITVPKVSPLSPGEILGCTAPTATEADLIIYVGDGRFHLESIMIANPNLPAYRYDPYTKKITQEYYDHELMRTNRFNAIRKAKSAKTFGVIKGTLGRQGSSSVLDAVLAGIKARGLKYMVILLSEIFPAQLERYGDQIDAFIQISCPRLSIDWGTFFAKPLLTPYEAAVALNLTEWMPHGHYPMDFYAYDSLGNWTPNYNPGKITQRRHIKIEATENKPRDLVQVPIREENSVEHGSEKSAEHCSEHALNNCTNCSCMYN